MQGQSEETTNQTSSEGTVSNLRHVAIIMDGNGRWAQSRRLPRTAGHKKGADAVERTVRAAADLGITHLTLFGFSTENWKRPKGEVSTLMSLLRQYLKSKTAEMHKNNVRMSVIGDRDRLDDDILELIEQAETLTKDNDGIHVLMALSYSGRWDLTQASRKLAEQVADGELSLDDLNEDKLEDALSTSLIPKGGLSGVPDVDLMIRTSGERRISNFLLWQGAYAELYFCDTYWPDFSAKDLEAAVSEYHNRDRRFGNIAVSS